MPTRLILIRHAQTSLNFKKRYSGAIDISLNHSGIKQAKDLRKCLSRKLNIRYSDTTVGGFGGLQAIPQGVTVRKFDEKENLRTPEGRSPYGQDSARGESQVPILIRGDGIYKIYSSDKKRAMQTARIVFRGKRIEKIRDLAEMDFGIFEGLTYKELMRKYPLIYKKWLDNPYSVNIPKAEHFRNFKKRIIVTFRNIVSMNKNKTIAVVSHGGAISIFINSILRSSEFFRYIPESASISIVEYKNKKPKIKLYNEVSHLNG